MPSLDCRGKEQKVLSAHIEIEKDSKVPEKEAPAREYKLDSEEGETVFPLENLGGEF